MHESTVAEIVAERGALRPPRDNRVRDRAELARAQRCCRRHPGRLRRDRDELRRSPSKTSSTRARIRRPAASCVAPHGLARQLDDIAGDDAVALLHALAGDLDLAGLEQLAEPAAACVWKVPRERLVDATFVDCLDPNLEKGGLVPTFGDDFHTASSKSAVAVVFGWSSVSSAASSTNPLHPTSDDKMPEPCLGCGCAIRCSPLRTIFARR